MSTPPPTLAATARSGRADQRGSDPSGADPSGSDQSGSDPAPTLASERITRLRRRYQGGPATLSIERARYYTRGWQDTEGSGLSTGVRVAAAMAHVYEHMTIYVDPDDRIAGHWSEQFLGLPIPIERGEYNEVLANELRRRDLLKARIRSGLRAGAHVLRKRDLAEFVRNQRRLTAGDRHAPLNAGLQTMSQRRINRFEIDDADRHELLGELLPPWKGASLTDVLESRLQGSGLYSKDMADFAKALPGNTSRFFFIVSAST